VGLPEPHALNTSRMGSFPLRGVASDFPRRPRQPRDTPRHNERACKFASHLVQRRRTSISSKRSGRSPALLAHLNMGILRGSNPIRLAATKSVASGFCPR
jgi:hypothetical protein